MATVPEAKEPISKRSVFTKAKELFLGASELMGKVVVGIFTPRWYILTFFLVITIAVAGYTFNKYLAQRPYVIWSNPTQDSNWSSFSHPIELQFDKPINSGVKFNISPQIPGVTELTPCSENSFFKDRFFCGLKFFPAQTVDPEAKTVIYLTELKNISGLGGVHEFPMEFYAPTLPEINSVSIEERQDKVLQNETIEVELSASNEPFIDWHFEFEPDFEISVEENGSNTISLVHDKLFDQGTDYQLKISRAKVKYDLLGEQIIEQGDYEEVKSIRFSTMKAPLVKKFSPQGDKVYVDEKIKIQFDVPMVTETVEQGLVTEPAIDFTPIWNETFDKLTLSPLQELAKDKKYKIIIPKGAKNNKGGIIPKDLEYSFKTIGPVQVKKFDPWPGATGVSVGTNITVPFDQPVDKKSAKNKFSISPNVGGNFSWKKNSLTFNPSSYLKYSTKYTVKVASGVGSIHGLPSKKAFTTSFTTAPQTVILNVPLYTQQESYSCNLAATRMALAYKGVYVSESSIKSGVGIGQALSGSKGGDPYADWINNYGVYWGPIASYVRRHRGATIKSGWNLSGLASEVSKGHPVIVWTHNGWSSWYWKTWKTPGGKTIKGLNGMHSLVVVGYKGPASNPNTIIVNDPWRGRLYYSAGSFDSTWAGSFGRTGVIVK